MMADMQSSIKGLAIYLVCLLWTVACQPTVVDVLPTEAALAEVVLESGQINNETILPATFTPVAVSSVVEMPAQSNPASIHSPKQLAPTQTRLFLPTNTPVTLRPTPFPTATPTPTPTRNDLLAPEKGPNEYSLYEPYPIVYYPRPANDNGWGIHWIPTVKQERQVIDRFITEVKRMHITWVVFLNDNTNIGDNDYLVERLTANGIMPIMRVYRSDVTPYDGDLGAMVRHYHRKGVYYYQLYNEPNVNAENNQGTPNPNHYATQWAAAAEQVIMNGGFAGIGALSPGGEYNHYQFLDRTLKTLQQSGNAYLLNRAWISVHNYHGLRPQYDPNGFFLYRQYDRIVQNNIHHSLPILGTEAGSYDSDPQIEKQQLIWQYSYMRQREPYFFVHSHWLLANELGGSFDMSWEYQTLFRQGFTHPVVTDFFYKYSR